MAPIVHGLEQQFSGRIDFLYLNVSQVDTRDAQTRYGFKATPHFIFLRADGTAVQDIQGVVPADSLLSALNRLLNTSQ